MRALVIVLLIILLFFACQSTAKTSTADKTIEKNDFVAVESTQDTIRIENKKLEYEIIIIEMGFDAWLVTQKPIEFYSELTLANRNIFYVSEWNQRVGMPNRYAAGLYNEYIDYDPSVDYGKEVNYMLFMFFEFFQDRYNQCL